MKAIDLISENIPPLIHTDSGEKAMIWMEEFKVSHLAVLKNGNFVGLLSESDILDRLDDKETLDVLFDHLPRLYVNSSVHVYEVLSKMAAAKVTVIPILNDQETYLGCISSHELLHHLASTNSMKEEGGILVIECNAIDYSMSQIAQIVESEGAKILSAYTSTQENSLKMDLVLKINKSDLSPLIASFDRFNYEIKASFHESSHEEDLQSRYEQFLKYLNF